MSKKQDLSLDPGFEEVSLDEGFEEVPMESSSPSASATPAPSDVPQQSSAVDNLKDIGQGAAQGLTLGFADELAGLIGASGKKLSNDKRDFSELYRQYKDLAEQSYEESKARSPYLTGISEFGAGALIPGGAAIKGAQGLSKAGAVLRGAGIGAATGAVGAVGQSKETELKELTKDAALGGAVGGILGGVTGGIGGVFSKGKSIADDELPLVRQTKLALEEGKQGKGFYSQSSIDRLNKESEEAVKSVLDPLSKGREFADKAYDDFLNSFDSPISPSTKNLESVSDLATVIEDKMGRMSSGKKLIDELAAYQEGKLLPRDIKNLQINLRKAQENIPGEFKDVFSDAQNAITGELKQLPGYDKVNDLFKRSRELSETITSKVPGEFNESYYSDLNKPKQALAEAAQKIIRKSQDEALGGRPQQEQLKRLQDLLTKTSSENPELLKSMGVNNVDDFVKNIRKSADKENLLQNIQGQDAFNKNNMIGDFASLGKRGLMLSSNLVGQAVGSMASSQSVPATITRALYTASDDMLRGVATNLKSAPGAKHLGSALEAALDNKSVAAKNAALFSIAQNPDARKVVDFFGLKDSKNE